MSKQKTIAREQLHNLGSLITYDDNGEDRCLGSLLSFEGNVFDPYFGKVDVTPEEAEAHNKALDEAYIKGLDETCEVGQGNYFYTDGRKVTTWTGMIVTQGASLTKRTITFARNGRVFRGYIRKDAPTFFKRIS